MFKIITLSTLSFLILFRKTFAHEAYVLPHDTFWSSIKGPLSSHAFDALKNSNNIRLTIIIGLSIISVLAINYYLRRHGVGKGIDKFFEKYAHFGPHFVRFTVAIALFFSAYSNSFLGPELYLSSFPIQQVFKISLYFISAMIAIGFMTELAAFLGIIIFLFSFSLFGSYIFTYFNYLGELIVLLLFGMRVFSVDKYLFGPLRKFKKFEKYETVIVRIMYGFALLYAGLTVKLLHPELTIDVVNTWHLTNFHWLFPSDPLLVTLGAGIVEIIIGLFIILGFEIRLTVLVSLFYITLSLFYFRELVWPHLLLYGISFNLLVQPEVFTLDHVLFKHHRIVKPWWNRIFSPHNRGKSEKI
ncbi:MAG: DoxX family membrane protein [Candidatus Pacebacteria bacterium]|nr:DoxX family membrane protein [Candidatus Paceibacterota bacterium]